MDKNILNGLKFGFGFILSFSLLFSLVFAVGWHSTSEIVSGTFLGNFVFHDNVTFNNVITINNSIAFNAYIPYITSTDIPANGQPFTGFTESLDEGNDFNTTSGVFVAPTDGLYSFDFIFSFRDSQSGDGADFNFYKNGAIVGYAAGGKGTSGAWYTVSNSIILRLNQGDEITIRPNAKIGTLIEAWKVATFNGYYIG